MTPESDETARERRREGLRLDGGPLRPVGRILDVLDVQGLDDEPSMIHEMWPGGDQPTTAVPDYVPNVEGNRGAEVVAGGDPADPPVVGLDGPAELSFICATEGKSIRYALDDGGWTLYTGPVWLETGRPPCGRRPTATATLTAKRSR